MVPSFSLAVTIAFKELRAGVSGFRIFIACLALGVAAIAGVGSLGEGITGGMEKDARRLLGGDVAFRLLHRPATDVQRVYLNSSAVISEVVEMFLGPLFMNLDTLEGGGLKSYAFFQVCPWGAKLRQCTSGTVTRHFFWPLQ